MNRIDRNNSGFLLKAIGWIFTLLFSALFVAALISSDKAYFWVDLGLQNVIGLWFLIVFILIAFYICFKTPDFVLKNSLKVCIGVLVLCFGFQLSMALAIKPDEWWWDVDKIVKTAASTDGGDEVGYFFMYPNNLFLVFLFHGFKPVFQLVNVPFESGLVIINVLAIDFSVLLAFLTARRLFGVKSALMALLLLLLLVMFFPWISCPYSDTMSMPFVIGTFYFFIRATSESGKRSVAFGALSGLFVTVGTMIKASSLVMMVAILLVQIVANRKRYFLKRPFRKRAVRILAGMISAVVITVGSFSAYCALQRFMDVGFGSAVPVVHFMAMGLGETETDTYVAYGGYSADDTKYTFSLKTAQEKSAENWTKYFERLKEEGFSGYMKFLAKKARWVMSDGTFYWGGEAGGKDMEDPEGAVQEAFYPTGKYIRAYKMIAQGLWVCVLGCAAVLPRKKFGERNTNESVLACSLIGILLFILLMEGRSRYIILYLPVFAVLAGQGIIHSVCKISKLKVFNKGQ